MRNTNVVSNAPSPQSLYRLRYIRSDRNGEGTCACCPHEANEHEAAVAVVDKFPARQLAARLED